jgi:hypothetical protein
MLTKTYDTLDEHIDFQGIMEALLQKSGGGKLIIPFC